MCDCVCRKPPDEYFPSFDLRDLSTVEELVWATGMDPTGGKEVTANIFSRDRLKEREVSAVFYYYTTLGNHRLPCNS